MAGNEILKTMKYSTSSIGTFEQCRMKFRFQYIDKIGKKIQSIEAFMGSCAHKALENLYNDVRNGRVPTIDDAIRWYDEEWDANYKDDIIIAKKEYTPEDYRNVGRKCVTDYYKSHQPFDDMHIIGLETDDTLVIGGDIGYYVRIDKFACKGDTFYVCDYKTNNKLKTQEEADADRQLAMYSAWVRQTYNTKNVKLVWHMLRFDRDVVSERTDEQIEDIIKQTESKVREIQSCTEWTTNPTALCGYCEFHDVCPEFCHVVKVEKEIEEKHFTEDEGAKLVDEYVRLDNESSGLKEQIEEISKRKDSLKEQIALFAKQYGCNAVGGTEKQANVKWEKKAKIPDEKVDEAIAILKDEGRFDGYLKFDRLKAEKDIASGKADGISHLADISESSRVTFSRKK